MIHEWVEDGHRVLIGWEADQLVIDRVECPFEGGSAFCNRKRNFCVVQRFVGVYGAETNVGSTTVLGPVEIAWLGVPGRGDSDLDAEFDSVWITPVDDLSYKAYKESGDSASE